MKSNHSGIRRGRTSGFVNPKLGYYLIITDTKETESNYFNGLRDSLPKDSKRNIVIKVIDDVKTKDLISEALDAQAKSPQFQSTWIVFDKDEVKNFDDIIIAAKSKGLEVGWSNPCFEIWLESYFGKMDVHSSSKKCCEHFGNLFKNKSGKEYEKNSKSIYQDLNTYGNEEEAIKLAQTKLNSAKETKDKPSKMNPATTVHELVKEIKEKTEH